MDNEVVTVVVAWLAQPFVEGLVNSKGAGEWLHARLTPYITPYFEIIGRRAQQMLKDVGNDAATIVPKRLMPILEGASLEDDPELQERWAAMLANEALASAQPRHNYAALLREVTAIDARVLDAIAGESPRITVLSVFAANSRITWSSRSTILGKILKGPTTLGSWHIDASLDNLTRLGLIHVTTEMHDPSGGTNPKDVIPIEFLSLTTLGLQFIEAIRPPRNKPTVE